MCSLKEFKCILAAINHQANDLPGFWNVRKGTKRMIDLKNKQKTPVVWLWPMNITDVKQIGISDL